MKMLPRGDFFYICPFFLNICPRGEFFFIFVRFLYTCLRGEWNGPWSERSWEWDSLSDRDKELLSVRVRNEGEFWMSFDDFAKQFSHLDLVHIGPDDWMSEPALHRFLKIFFLIFLLLTFLLAFL